MTRLSLQVVYLWRHVSSPPFILWWSNLEIQFAFLHRSSPFTEELRCQAIQMEHGPHIAERTQKAVYIVRCLWVAVMSFSDSNIFLSEDQLHSEQSTRDNCQQATCNISSLQYFIPEILDP
jgi:hypothetical protein